MGVGNAAKDLIDDFDGLRWLDGPAFHPLAQVRSANHLHHHEELPFVGAKVGDLDQAWVLKDRRQTSLPLETGGHGRTRREFGMKEFES